MNKWQTSILLAAFVVFLGACSNQAQRVYEESTYGPALDVPPDMTMPAEDSGFAMPELAESPATIPVTSTRAAGKERAALPVLPEQENINVEHDGAQRWLVLQGEPAQIWPWVRDFLLKEGFELAIEDPVIGIVETDWKQQRRNLPMEGKQVAEQYAVDEKIYAVPTREKYRVRLERGEKPGTTELFLTHRGVELDKKGSTIVWRLRPSNPELEAEMLNRLLVFLGASQEQAGGLLAAAEQRRKTSITKDNEDHMVLKVDNDFTRTWRRVGFALDRLNFVIEDRDRADGNLLVRTRNPLKDAQQAEQKSWFARLFSSDEDTVKRYKLILRDEGATTNITIHTSGGTFVDNKTAEPILHQLADQLQ
jgi:outer membrane protein assembly factor BamC